MEVLMFLRALTSASLVLAIAALLPFCVGCDTVPDMSAPVAASDVTTERSVDDPASDDFVIMSPSTLVLESPGWGLTVHVAIPYSEVVPSTVRLEDVVPQSVFFDDCGDLVCKFLRQDICDLAVELLGTTELPAELTLTISGDCIVGSSFGIDFSDTDTITVR
jgi:hypothetical protein